MKLNCADVLTLITGNLFVSVDRLYQLYNGMTGDNLFTHQLPRAFHACEPVARQQWPEIAAFADSAIIGPDNYLGMLGIAKSEYGDEFDTLPLLTWKLQDPIQELAEMVPSEKIIGVMVSPDAKTVGQLPIPRSSDLLKMEGVTEEPGGGRS